jgi:hypothetical protein
MATCDGQVTELEWHVLRIQRRIMRELGPVHAG